MDFLPAFAGPGGETLNQFQNFMDTYGPHLKNLLGIILALAIFVIFLRLLKKFKPSEAEVQILGEDDQQLLSVLVVLGGDLPRTSK